MWTICRKHNFCFVCLFAINYVLACLLEGKKTRNEKKNFVVIDGVISVVDKFVVCRWDGWLG